MEGIRLQESLSEAFSGSVMRAMRVASRNDEGERRDISRLELSRRLDIDRGTLASYLDSDGALKANLRTVSKMAEALKVPPAFLLMRRQDWVAVATAVTHLEQIVIRGRKEDLRAPLAEHERAQFNANTAAKLGLQLAELMGVHARPARGGDFRQAIHQHEQTADGIAATCALPPLTKLKPLHITPVLALCALVGITTQAPTEIPA